MSESSTEDGDVKHIAYLLGCDQFNVYKLAKGGIIPKPAKGQRWNIPLCVHQGAVDLRKRTTEGGKESKSIILANEAEQSKMRTAEMQERLCPKQQCLDDYKDYQARVISAIQARKKISEAEQRALIKDIAAIRLPDLKKDDDE